MLLPKINEIARNEAGEEVTDDIRNTEQGLLLSTTNEIAKDDAGEEMTDDVKKTE